MAESEKAKKLRLRKEKALGQILAGERTGTDVAREWKVTRQAVSLWLQRFKSQGNLKPGKRGRKKLVPFTEMQKGMFFQKVLTLYAERGYKLGDEVPRRDCLEPKDLKSALGEIAGKNCSISRTRNLMKELRLPLFLDSNPYFSKDDHDDWDDEDFEFYPQYLRDPSQPDEESEPAAGDGQSSQEMDRRRDENDDDDLKIPKTPEEYEKWIKETQAMMKKQGVKWEPGFTAEGERVGSGIGIRTGKHAKGSRQRPPKKRKKKGKKRS